MKKWFIALSLILLIIPVGIYLSLPTIAAHVVQSWLVDQGFQKPVFTLDYPDHKVIQISELSVEKHTENRISILKAGPVRITYSPWDLLLSGQLTRIEIPQASLDIQLLISQQAGDIVGQEDISTATSATDLAQFLPQYLLLLIPAKELVVGQLDTLIHAEGKPNYRLTGNLYLTSGKQLLSRVLLSFKNQSIARADLTLSSDNQLSLTAHELETPFFNLKGSLTTEVNRLILRTEHQLALDQTDQLLSKLGLLDDRKWQITQGEWHATTNLSIDSQLNNLESWLSSLTAEQHSEIKASAKLTTTPIKGAELSLLADGLYSSTQGLVINTHQGSQISLRAFKQAQTSADQFSLTLETPLRFSLMDNKILEPASVAIDSQNVKYADWAIQAAPLKIDIQSADINQQAVAMTFNTDRITLGRGKQKLPSIAVKGKLATTEEKLTTTLQVTGDELPIHLTASVNTTLQDLNSTITWQLNELPLPDPKKRWINQLPFSWPKPLTITRGGYAHQAEFNWRDGQLSGKITQALTGLDLSYDKILLTNANFNSQLLIRNNRIDDTGNLTIEALDTGVVIHNLQSRYKMNKLGTDNAIFDLQSLTAELLGGKIDVTPFYSVIKTPAFKTSLSIDELSLDELLKLEQEQGLTGEGRLSGNLPLHLGEKGFSVTNGFLKTNGSGVIQYQPTPEVQALGQSNQGMSMALAALENFHYSSLSAAVNYEPNGSLMLATNLQGANPHWNQGHPVNFTINVSENLHKLLKSLQFADDLTQQIETRYRKSKTNH